MKIIKKLIYLYLTIFLLFCLFLPFTAQASQSISPKNQFALTDPGTGLVVPQAPATPAPTAAAPIPQTTSANTGSSIGELVLGPNCTSENLITCYETKIIRLFIWVALIGSIFMIIIGGITLITSGGAEKKITAGKLEVTGAIIGLVIVLLSYSIQQFVQNRITNGSPTSVTNSSDTGTSITLDAQAKANSLAGTANIPWGVNSTIIYTKGTTGTAVSQVNNNTGSCANVTISGSTVPCLIIISGLKQYYPDAAANGEIDSASDGRTYYLKGMFLHPDGTVDVYYVKTAGSNQIYYDTWTASLSSSVNQSTKRVMCVYLGKDDFRKYIYTCYEDFNKAASKLNQLDSTLESQGLLGKPCDPITSTFGASDLLAQNPGTYCANDGLGCSGAEGTGNTLFLNICGTSPSGNFNKASGDQPA